MSSWFVLCTSFGSLFIVTGKRYAELRELGEGSPSTARATLEDYSLGFLRIVLSISCAATLVAYCQWAFQVKEISGTQWPFYELSIVPMLMALAALSADPRTGPWRRAGGDFRRRPHLAGARCVVAGDLRLWCLRRLSATSGLRASPTGSSALSIPPARI